MCLLQKRSGQKFGVDVETAIDMAHKEADRWRHEAANSRALIGRLQAERRGHPVPHVLPTDMELVKSTQTASLKRQLFGAYQVISEVRLSSDSLWSLAVCVHLVALVSLCGCMKLGRYM